MSKFLPSDIFNSINAIVYVADLRSGKLLYINKNVRDLYGEVEGKICWQALRSGQTGPGDFRIDEHLLVQRGTPGPAVFRQIHDKIADKWYDIRDQAIQWNDGRLVRLRIAFDVTEKKKAEIALSFLREILNHINNAVYIIEPETGSIFDCNSHACAHLGYTRDELLKKHIIDIESSLILDHHEWHERTKNLENNNDMLYQSVHKRKDGTTYPVEVNVKYITSPEKKYLMIIAKDLSQETDLLNKIIKAKKEWEQAFDIINDAITIHDTDFKIIRANRAAEKLLGIPMNDIFKFRCYESYHGTLAAPVNCPSCKTMKTSEPTIVEIFEPHLGKYLEIKALPRLDEDNNIIGLIHIVRDISERKKSEIAQEDVQKQLLEAQKLEAVSQLAAGVSHDFNNLLTGILGYTGLVAEQLEGQTSLLEDLDQVTTLARRAERLTRRLLAFSRFQPMEPVEININDLVENLGKTLRRLLGEKIDLRFFLEADPGAIVADPGLIEQVLINLAVNARHAMHNEGLLTLKTKDVYLNGREKFYAVSQVVEGQYVSLEIVDNGYGMNQKAVEQIFEPYFSTKGSSHSGLGMSMIYGIVKKHRGYIKVVSKPGVGTSVATYFPAIDKDNQNEQLNF